MALLLGKLSIKKSIQWAVDKLPLDGILISVLYRDNPIKDKSKQKYWVQCEGQLSGPAILVLLFLTFFSEGSAGICT